MGVDGVRLGGLVVEVDVNGVPDLRPHDGAHDALPRLHGLLLVKVFVGVQLVHRLLVDAADTLRAAFQVKPGVTANESD